MGVRDIAASLTLMLALGQVGCTMQQAAGTSSTSTPTTSLSASRLPLEIVSLTSPTRPGQSVTLTVRTAPGAHCYYHTWHELSGTGKTGDPPPAIADAEGWATWSWTVPLDFKTGTWRIVVSATMNGTRAERQTVLLAE